MKKNILTAAILFQISFQCFAGGWISSGGELFQLNKNPWFVKNTTKIQACILIDQTSMSASEETIRKSVQAAVDYWKNEFHPQNDKPKDGFALLATQDFQLQSSCTSDTDIRFVFGYGALSTQEPNNEVAYLQDPQRYVGVTVRTQYDYKTLKGKGFVYISGDTGTHPYHNAGNLIEKAWENEKLLQYALIHEVGHIMGLPHSGVGLMSEVFLDQLLNKRFSKYYIENPIQSFLNPPMTFEVCQASNGTFSTTFFAADPATKCLSVTGNLQQGGQIQWEISGKLTASSPATKLGIIRGNFLLDTMLGAKPSIIIQLPSEQTVFTATERMFNSFILGPVYIEGSAKGNFIATTSPKPNDLHLEIKTDSMTFVGLVGGKQQVVLVYNPPSLLKMLFPVVGP